MKKLFLITAVCFSVAAAAQSSFGIKAGLNYADNGDVEFRDVSNAGEDAYYGAERKAGYHLGAYFRAPIGNFYLRPEILYTQIKSSYAYNNEEADYDIKKFDLPILLGYNVFGPLHVFGGPSLQYITDHDLEGVTFGEVENSFTVGVQFGAGIQFGSFGLDARYERSLSETHAEVLDFNNALGGVRRIDIRPSQFIISLSLDL